MDMQYIKLNNGIEMPQIGLGTFLIPKDKAGGYSDKSL